MANTVTVSTKSGIQVLDADGPRELTMDELDDVAGGGGSFDVTFSGCDHVYNVTYGGSSGYSIGQAVEHAQWLHSFTDCA